MRARSAGQMCSGQLCPGGVCPTRPSTSGSGHAGNTLAVPRCSALTSSRVTNHHTSCCHYQINGFACRLRGCKSGSETHGPRVPCAACFSYLRFFNQQPISSSALTDVLLASILSRTCLNDSTTVPNKRQLPV